MPQDLLVDTTTLRRTAQGIRRPEHVTRRSDGKLFASDQGSAIAELMSDGSIRRIGALGGEPNGFSFTPSGVAVVTDFSKNAVYLVDPSSGETTLFLDHVGDQPLTHANCALAAPDGTIWISCSTRSENVMDALSSRAADGFIVRVDPAGKATIAADSVRLYYVRPRPTQSSRRTHRRVRRCPIRDPSRRITRRREQVRPQTWRFGADPSLLVQGF